MGNLEYALERIQSGAVAIRIDSSILNYGPRVAEPSLRRQCKLDFRNYLDTFTMMVAGPERRFSHSAYCTPVSLSDPTQLGYGRSSQY